MPELPDLTVYAKNLNKWLSGKTVTDLTVFRPGQLNVEPVSLHKVIVNKQIDSFEREGKEIVLVFSNGHKLAVHLMLMGRFEIVCSIGSSYDKIVAIKFEEPLSKLTTLIFF